MELSVDRIHGMQAIIRGQAGGRREVRLPFDSVATALTYQDGSDSLVGLILAMVVRTGEAWRLARV